jgi:uncharacterized caspase-like protein
MRSGFGIFALFFVLASTPLYAAQKWALVIGVAGYPHFPKEQQLRFADRDARAFADFIKTPQGGSFNIENIHLIVNDQAKRADFFREFDWFFREVGPEDTLYVFYAGHGFEFRNTLYFLPYDSEPQHPDDGGIPMSEFFRRVTRDVAAKQVVVFVDACHAAGASEGSRDPLAIDVQRQWNQLNDKEGQVSMALFSSLAYQKSWEDRDLGEGHGLFTWYLLEGLKGAAKGPDGYVTADALFDYVRTKVENRSREKFPDLQTPSASTRFRTNYKLAYAGAPTDLASKAKPQFPSTGYNPADPPVALQAARATRASEVASTSPQMDTTKIQQGEPATSQINEALQWLTHGQRYSDEKEWWEPRGVCNILFHKGFTLSYDPAHEGGIAVVWYFQDWDSNKSILSRPSCEWEPKDRVHCSDRWTGVLQLIGPGKASISELGLKDGVPFAAGCPVLASSGAVVQLEDDLVEVTLGDRKLELRKANPQINPTPTALPGPVNNGYVTIASLGCRYSSTKTICAFSVKSSSTYQAVFSNETSVMDDQGNYYGKQAIQFSGAFSGPYRVEMRPDVPASLVVEVRDVPSSAKSLDASLSYGLWKPSDQWARPISDTVVIRGIPVSHP